MPNFGAWEIIVVLVIIVIPCGIAIMFSPRVIADLLTEIRAAWHTADPRDNHKDR